jgi:hypothetical protein
MESTSSDTSQEKAPTQGGGGETLSLISDHSDDDDEDSMVPMVVNDSDGLTFVNNHFGENKEGNSLDMAQTTGKGIYNMYRKGEVINPKQFEINEVLSTLDIDMKKQDTIERDLDAAEHEYEELKVRKDQLDMNNKCCTSLSNENASKLVQLQKVVEEKMKISFNEKSAILFKELMESQQKIETLQQQQKEIEKELVDLTSKRTELEEMQKDIDLKKSELISLKSDTEVKIRDGEIALYKAFQKSETDSKVEEIASNVVTSATHNAMSEIDAEHSTHYICETINAHKKNIKHTEQQFKKTQKKRFYCVRQYNELNKMESSLEIKYYEQIECYENYKIGCESQMVTISNEIYEKMKTTLSEMGILRGIIHYGTKSKDTLFSLTAMNPRFCVDDGQGTVHFFKKDWTHTKSLTLSEENTKVPMKLRDTCISETKDYNYNLTQMKPAIILVNGNRISPVIHYWK